MSTLSWKLMSVRALPLGAFFMRAETATGEIQLRPIRGVTEGHLVEMEYRPALPSGLDHRTAFETYRTLSDVEQRHQVEAHLGYRNVSLGYISGLPLALDAINRYWGAEANGNSKSTVDALTERGFSLAHTIPPAHPQRSECAVYRRPWKKGRGEFSLFVHDHALHLVFEKRRQARWHNVLRFQSHHEGESGQMEPVLWPTEFSFSQVALPLALDLADAWDPEQTYSQ